MKVEGMPKRGFYFFDYPNFAGAWFFVEVLNPSPSMYYKIAIFDF